MRIKTVFIIVIVGLILILSAQNTSSVQLTAFVWDFSMPLVFLIYGLIVTGFIIGLVYSGITSRSRRKKKEQQNELPEGDMIYPDKKKRKKNS